MIRRFLVKSWPIITIVVITFVFFARLFVPQPSIFITPDYGRSDAWHLSIANKFYYAQELKKNRIPIWNPKIGTGFPTLAEGQTAIFFLPNLILFRLLPFVYAYNLTLVLAFITAGIGTYLFCRSLKLNKLAAAYAGIIFALGGFFIVHVQHHNLLQTATLLPWLFWTTNEFLNKRKVIFLIGLSFFLSQQIFAGFPQITFYSLAALYIYTFLKCTFKNLSKFKIISLLTIAVIFGSMLSAIQLLPSYELLQVSTKQSSPKLILLQFPYKFKNLLQFLDPFILGSPKDGSYPRWIPGKWGVFWESIAYVGILPLVLAIAATIGNLLKKSGHKASILTLSFLGGISLLLALGISSPLHPIFSLPPFSIFRVPSRFLLIVQFSLAILGAIYLQKISRRKILSALIAVLSTANLFWVFYSYNPIDNAKKWFKMPKTAQYLNSQSSRILSLGQFKRWTDHFLNEGWNNNSDFYYFARNSLDQNSNLIFSIDQFGTYESILTKRFSHINSHINSAFSTENGFQKNTLKLLASQNVSHIITPANLANNNLARVLKISDGNPFNIYKIPYKPQRFYMVSKYQIAKTVPQVNGILSQEDYDPKTFAILEKEPDLPIKTNKLEYKINIIEESPTKIILKTQQDKNAILIIADSFYPGWKAFIDGQETEILAANINSRAILLSKGKHLVIFRYESRSFYLGILVTLIGISAVSSIFKLRNVKITKSS